MKDLKEYINEELKPEINLKDTSDVTQIDVTSDYVLYMRKHADRRRYRHVGEDPWGAISIPMMKKIFNRAYSKIMPYYSSRKLTASKTGTEAFVLHDSRTDINMVCCLHSVNKDTGQSNFVIITVIKTKSFRTKNNGEFTTYEIYLENLLQNSIIIEI